jgi:hypothetical protein
VTSAKYLPANHKATTLIPTSTNTPVQSAQNNTNNPKQQIAEKPDLIKKYSSQ